MPGPGSPRARCAFRLRTACAHASRSRPSPSASSCRARARRPLLPRGASRAVAARTPPATLCRSRRARLRPCAPAPTRGRGARAHGLGGAPDTDSRRSAPPDTARGDEAPSTAHPALSPCWRSRSGCAAADPARATCGGDTPRPPALRRVQTAAPRSAHGGRTPPSPLGMRAPPRPPPRGTPPGCATPARGLSRTARSRSSAPRTSDPALRPASPAPAVHPPTADPAQQSAPPAGPPRRGPRARGSRRRHRSTGPALPPARRSSHPGPWRSAAGSSAPGLPPASRSTTPRHHARSTASRRESVVSTAGDTRVPRANRCRRRSTAIVSGRSSVACDRRTGQSRRLPRLPSAAEPRSHRREPPNAR